MGRSALGALAKAGAVVQAAAVTEDITPKGEVTLGAGYHDAPEWKIHSHPELNMLAMWMGQPAPLVLVTVDALYAGARLRATIEEELDGVPPENIVVAASHTHAAPMLDDTKPKLGLPDPEHLEYVLTRAREGIEKLLDPDRRVAARVLAGKARADHSINRRQVKRITWTWPPQFNSLRWRPDFWGKRDETVTALRFQKLDGAELAVLWNYACHPVGFPLQRTVSTDFPGIVRDVLREDLGEDLPVLFFQGFSGDTRPLDLAEPRIPPSLRHLNRRVRFGPEWDSREKTLAEYEAGAHSLAERVRRAVIAAVPIDFERFSATRVNVNRSLFVESEGNDLSFQAIKLGEAFGLVAVSGEVVVEYAARVRRWLGTRYSMLVGCADDVMGYLPTKKMMHYGGYEGDRFVEHFDLGPLNPALEENTLAQLRRVTGKA